MNTKFATLLTLALAAGTLSAHATEVTFSGTSTGFFSTSATATSGSTSDGELSYVGSSFMGTTVGDFVAFNTVGDNFGDFVNSGLGGGTNEFFTLITTFTLPAGVSPNPVTYTATLTGSVAFVGGGVQLTYSPNTSTFSYSGGSATMRIDNVAVNAASSTPENGSITATPSTTPEPSSLILLGTGLLGVAGAARRRFIK